MNEVLTYPLEQIIKKKSDDLLIVCTPLVSSEKDIAMVIKKRQEKFFPEVFYVSYTREDNSTYITYDKLKDYNDKYTNCLFVCSNLKDLFPYIDLIKDNQNNNNFLSFNTIFTESKLLKQYVENIEIIIVWPSFANLDINFLYETRENYIAPPNNELYMEKFNSDEKDIEDIKGILNVFLDDKVKSLTELDMNRSLLRTPKFKNIIVDLLLNNKKRHYIYMLDGMGGIDSFKILYDKVKENNKEIPYLMIIKKTDNEVKISEKLQDFNKSNMPIILLTDIAFKEPKIPMNIDCVRIVNGGDENIINTIFHIAEAKYYTGIYPRNIYVVNYLSKNTYSTKTFDELQYMKFKDVFINREQKFSECKKRSSLLIEDDSLVVSF